MALIVSQQTAADAYIGILRQGKLTRDYMAAKKVAFLQPTADAASVLAVVQHVRAVLAIFDAHAAVPGLAQYARDQQSNQAYDVAAEYAAMRAALVALRDGIVSLFPRDGEGYLLYQKLEADGNVTIRTFTSANLTPVVALIDAVLASIA